MIHLFLRLISDYSTTVNNCVELSFSIWRYAFLPSGSGREHICGGAIGLKLKENRGKGKNMLSRRRQIRSNFVFGRYMPNREDKIRYDNIH